MDYFDTNIEISDEDLALKEAAHKFAAEVMRPTAKKLDRMTADEVVADGSPLWDFLKQAYELGYHKVLLPDHIGGLGLSPSQIHLVYEELGWGSFGLAVHLAVVSFPFYMAVNSGDEELIEKFAIPFCECTDGSIRGCWGGTEPDHGSDLLAFGTDYFSSPECKGNVRAKLDGEEYVINGQKASWVSGGTVATHCLLHLQIDPSRGFAGGGICVIPLDLPGVSRGKALNKLGQRDLNQGELFFDDVRIPEEWMFVQPDFYEPLFDMILAYANACMSTWATGLARAAFEEAFTYCKERVQGGKELIKHDSIQQRLFQMFARVETCRALSRMALNLNMNVTPPFTEYSIVAKTQATQMCFDNANDAVQLLGGNGLTHEYFPEKLFRDARATLIEDGNNEMLARAAGYTLMETYPRSQRDI
jgi:alkylation response protein AidB-like acyl-CoA dehydrogenase